MAELYKVSLLLIKICGPLAVLFLMLMYAFLIYTTKKFPKPGQVIFLYARYHLERKKHAGILTYLFVGCSIFFILSLMGLIIGQLFHAA
jgi:hypothetical protein